ncbi:hypothetical protein [Calothrix sp. NIES-2098]|uniref:hypothetical protein n=1 Tax=Calothrix sp. NIES-2098 TaxID=1954171 RepID=UPI000B5DBF80|nr:hypothetical protein NIES2098_73540 [Calothrix sp. NIES-2098]
MTSEQRHELVHEFAVQVATFIGCDSTALTIDFLAETDPRAKRALELARKLVDAVEQAIS